MKDKNVFYSCPYCKEEYAEPGDLARCILNCEDKKRIEEEKAKKAKLEAEKEARKAEIDETENKLGALIRAYIKDYGSYNTTRTHDADGFSRLWHMIF